MSNKERQARFRAKKAEQGLIEVRGIYAKKELHKSFKFYAARINAFAASIGDNNEQNASKHMDSNARGTIAQVRKAGVPKPAGRT